MITPIAARIRFFAGICLGLVVRAWVATLRVRVVAPPSFREHGPGVYAFWHGQQMALLGARSLAGDAAVLVSRSTDGDIQAGVMTALGFRVVRGSSSRGGARALAALIRVLRAGSRVLLAVDGPHGPRHIAKPGAAAAAAAGCARLFPVAMSVRPALVLSRAWDGFELPLPFASVVIVVGSPLDPGDARREPARLAQALEACGAAAGRLREGDPPLLESTGETLR